MRRKELGTRGKRVSRTMYYVRIHTHVGTYINTRLIASSTVKITTLIARTFRDIKLAHYVRRQLPPALAGVCGRVIFFFLLPRSAPVKFGTTDVPKRTHTRA